MEDLETEIKRLLNEFDSKHNVSISATERNINNIAERIVKLFSIPVVSNCICSECCKKTTELLCHGCAIENYGNGA